MRQRAYAGRHVAPGTRLPHLGRFGLPWPGLLLLPLLLGACLTAASDVPAVADTLLARITAVPARSAVSEPLILSVSGENPADKPLVFLPWGTPLEHVLSADVFIVHYAGERLVYRGRLVKRAVPEAEDFIAIRGGESLTRTHDLARYYDLSRAGSYSVSLKPGYRAGTVYRQDAAAISSAASGELRFERY